MVGSAIHFRACASFKGASSILDRIRFCCLWGGGRRNLYQAGGEENGIYGYALLLVEFGLVLLQTWVLVQDFQEVQSLSKKG